MLRIKRPYLPNMRIVEREPVNKWRKTQCHLMLEFIFRDQSIQFFDGKFFSFYEVHTHEKLGP